MVDKISALCHSLGMCGIAVLRKLPDAGSDDGRGKQRVPATPIPCISPQAVVARATPTN